MAGASLQLPSAANGLRSQRWHTNDPRSSSTQSLVPSLREKEGKRTLLVIYIHGFMGNDSSFRSFPAHVHSFLREALVDTHVIHSKIYPRYKTYKAIEVARDNFSAWLQPHESPTTDVILIGHSMGGLLAGEVALMPSYNTTAGYPFRHRILGTVSLDAPLLGLHPGIVVSGIASLFRPAASPATMPESLAAFERVSPDPVIYSEVAPPSGASSPTLPSLPPPSSRPATNDPLFNPPFFNDVSFIDRGWFKNITHFAKKHRQENLVEAAATHIMSHLEFGGCLADYPGLRSRYNKLRKLEDDNRYRIRFVNYYTVSAGSLGKTKQPRTEDNARPFIEGYSSDVESRVSTPRISIEDYDDGRRPKPLQPEPDESDQSTKNSSSPKHEPSPTMDGSTFLSNGTDEIDLQLPPIPDLPSPPVPPDPNLYTNRDARKQAEKETRRAKKMYEQAVKNRDRAIKERQKLIDKHRRKSAKEAERIAREEQRTKSTQTMPSSTAESQGLVLQPDVEERLRDTLALANNQEQEPQQPLSREESRAMNALTPSTSPPILTLGGGANKKKERKFCMLPCKVNGALDPTWIRVYMEGVDEVGAHCGLFFPGPHYETLVGDVGSRIIEWVQEDASRRAIAG